MAALVRRDPIEAGFAPRRVRACLELRPVEGSSAGSAEAPVGVRSAGTREVLGEVIAQDGRDRHLAPTGARLQLDLALHRVIAALHPDDASGEVDCPHSRARSSPRRSPPTSRWPISRDPPREPRRSAPQPPRGEAKRSRRPRTAGSWTPVHGFTTTSPLAMSGGNRPQRQEGCTDVDGSSPSRAAGRRTPGDRVDALRQPAAPSSGRTRSLMFRS